MTKLYEEAIDVVKNKNIFQMDVVFTGPVLLAFFVGLPFLIVTFLTKEAVSFKVLFSISLAGYLIWALYATIARDKNKRVLFNSVCEKIEDCADEPYKFNKYIYDNLQFIKHNNLGHAKFLAKGISYFQITRFITNDHIPIEYRHALIVIGFVSTTLFFILHVIDDRSETLKTALQFSQEKKWKFADD